jgi:hypothetical protein
MDILNRPRRNALVEMVDMKEGWVLVFDLDQTITACDIENNVEFNPKIVEILKGAVKDREKGIVSAIFLLTNNADGEYIEQVHKELNTILQTTSVFDYILDANHPIRSHMPGVNIRNAKQKTIADVEFMLQQVKKTSKNLINRLLFFDDQEHILSLQLKSAGNPQHFIHVNPPFLGTFEIYQPKTTTRKRKKTLGTRKIRVVS